MKKSRFFYDTEFIEKPGSIELISIGIVHQNGAKLSLVCKDFNVSEAYFRDDNKGVGKPNYWLRENVLKPIFSELEIKDPKNYDFNLDNLFYLLDKYGFTKEEIANKVLVFVRENTEENEEISFYGYYSSYDHVVLCWLFGRMIDLPKGFPMYTIDLKQELDSYVNYIIDKECYSSGNHCILDPSTVLTEIKEDPSYPSNYNVHSALDDAEFNLGLFNFFISKNYVVL